MIGIIGAMEDEVKLLAGAMEETERETIGAFEFIRGKLLQKPVVLLRCGVGKVNAAAGCAVMITRYGPELVINTGSAGGLDGTLTVGDLIISTGLLYHDVDVTGMGCAPGQLLGMPAVFDVPEPLAALAEAAMDELKAEGLLSVNHVRGVIGSGDVFMHEYQRIAAVRRLFPQVKAVEMEGAAIAHVCYLFKTPALVIRAVSDIAGRESPQSFKEFLPLASKHSAELVRRLVRNYF